MLTILKLFRFAACRGHFETTFWLPQLGIEVAKERLFLKTVIMQNVESCRLKLFTTFQLFTLKVLFAHIILTSW